MPYFLVLLRRGGNAEDQQRYTEAHEQFISSLIKRNVVLLGGTLAEEVDDVDSAYVLRCDSVDEARGIAAEDPFVFHMWFARNVLSGSLSESTQMRSTRRPSSVRKTCDGAGFGTGQADTRFLR
jgi:uncharacterized protein YciI